MFSLLFWSGLTIINSLAYQFGSEALTEKLNMVLHALDRRYAAETTAENEHGIRVQESRKEALADLSSFRYKDSGRAFVIRDDKSILLSGDFSDHHDAGFDDFFALLQGKKAVIQYRAGPVRKFAVFTYYQPWQSFIGISINRRELFALTGFFFRISLLLLAAYLLSTILLAGLIQRKIISPIIHLSHFANQVSNENYDGSLPGSYFFELGELKNDMQRMAATLYRKMHQTAEQFELLKEREARLDSALSDLRKSEKKYRTIYDAPTDAIFIIDPQSGKILDANKAMLMMFGYTTDELHNLTFARLSSGDPPYTEDEANIRLGRAMAKGAQFFEWLAQRSNGEAFWVEISLRLTDIEQQKQLIAIVRNIHIKKMAEQELATEKERLSITLRSIGEGVITTDVNGRINLMNRVAEKLTGWRQAEAAGRVITEVFHTLHPETERPVENPIEKILFSGHSFEPAQEVILVGRDGKRRNIINSGAPINDQHNVTTGTVMIFRDVTEKKQMEEELFRANKLESVGVLAGGIAHVFNNILTAILGSLSLARYQPHDAKLTASLLEKVEQAALKARDLTSQLLTFSHGGKPIMQTTFLGPLIKESTDYVMLGSNIPVQYDIPDDLLPVDLDPGQINQVFQNLVINARQAMGENGKLEISCSNIGNCPGSAGTGARKCIQIRIADNGCGIATDALPRIFDPYFTTKKDGTGLGLSICHSIVNKHGGQISVQSVLGSGTTLTIQLPASHRKNTKQPSSGLMDMKPSDQNARILIMDDDQMIIDLSKQILEHLGHEVVTSGDGKTTLEHYRKAMAEDKPFDIVILDLTIPGGMGGKETIKQLLCMDPDARAIVSSGYSHDPVMAEYQDYGFKGVIVKPYQVEDLKKIIQETLQIR